MERDDRLHTQPPIEVNSVVAREELAVSRTVGLLGFAISVAFVVLSVVLVVTGPDPSNPISLTFIAIGMTGVLAAGAAYVAYQRAAFRMREEAFEEVDRARRQAQIDTAEDRDMLVSRYTEISWRLDALLNQEADDNSRIDEE